MGGRMRMLLCLNQLSLGFNKQSSARPREYNFSHNLIVKINFQALKHLAEAKPFLLQKLFP